MRSLRRDTRGLTSAEWLIIAALLLVGSVAALRLTSTAVDNKGDRVAGCIAGSGQDCGAAAPSGQAPGVTDRALSAARETLSGDLQAAWESGAFLGNYVKGVGLGAFDMTKGLVTLAYRSFADPGGLYNDTAKGLSFVWNNPSAAWQALEHQGEEAFYKNPGEFTGRAVFDVASLFLPTGVGEIGEAADAARAARAAEETADAARAAEEAAAAARLAEAANDTRAITEKVLAEYGLTRDSYVYRVTDPAYVDVAGGTVTGNPNSMAQIGDVYHPVESPMVKSFQEAGYPVDSLPPTIAPNISATTLKPGLNVAVVDPAPYAQPGQIEIAIRVGDILDRGGMVYPDTGAIAQGIKPLYFTFDGSVPVKIVQRGIR